MKRLKVNVAALTATMMLSVSSAMPSYASNTALDAINSASQNTIADVVAKYLTEAGRNDVYTALPDCDRITINRLLLDDAPYENDTALSEAYQTALETATQADKNLYDVFVEDFSSNNLETNGWEYTNLRGYTESDKSAVGTQNLVGIERKSLNISGEETSSFMFTGSSLRANETGLTGAKSTITKKVINPASIVTMYIAVLNEPTTCVAGIQFNDTMSLRTGGTSFYATTDMPNQGGAAGPIGNTEKSVWNKITLDGIAEPGRVKAYLNNEYLYTFNDTMDRIEIGSIFDNAGGFSVVVVDNISIATKKSKDAIFTDFNSNAVTQSRLRSFLNITAKSGNVFASLVDCDRSLIVNKIEAERPYESIEAFETAYQSILEDVTGNVGAGYTVAWQEDFDNGLSSAWTVTGTLRGNSVGTDNMDGIGYPRYSLDISGENASAGFVGAAMVNYSANYITRSVDNPQSIVTLYFYDYNNETTTPRMFFGINDTDFISRTDSSGYYSYQTDTNGNMKLTNVPVSQNWHKVVFDGITEKGYVNAYLDGVKVFRTANDIEHVSVGNKWTNGSYTVVWADHITVAEYDKKAAFDTFNASEVTTDSLSAILPDAGKSNVFDVLPACDKTAIVQTLEEARPFADMNAFTAAYQEALENTTGKIGNDYALLWQEDFDKDESDGDYYTNNWSIGGFLRGNAIGEGNMSGISGSSVGDRQYLNVSETDNKSAGFVAAGLMDLQANYITRPVSDPNSVVTLYFNDVQNDSTPSYYFKINDNDYIGRSNLSGVHYSYWHNGVQKDTQVQISKGWHKVVFDGVTNEGIVTAYIDGVEVFQSDNEIEYVSVGNHETYNGFDIVWVDHITVAKGPNAEKKEQVKVTWNGIECKDILPENARNVTVKVENAKFKTDYIIAGYDSLGSLESLSFLTKEEQASAAAKTVEVKDINELKIFAWDSLKGMTPVQNATILSK